MDLDSHEELLEQLMTVLVEIEEKFKNQKEGSEVRFEDFVRECKNNCVNTSMPPFPVAVFHHTKQQTETEHSSSHVSRLSIYGTTPSQSGKAA